MNAVELLDHINPSDLEYQEWVNVGMALKHEGCDMALWDAWSQRDHRYKAGECAVKWKGFHGSGTPVTVGTIVEYAKRSGWKPEYHQTSAGRGLDWDEVIQTKASALTVVDTGWLEDVEVSAINAQPWRQLQMYLEALFEASDYVGYCCEARQSDEKWIPANKGIYTKTAGEIIAGLSKYKDIGAAIGDSNAEAGAWIRFNPMDGQGVRDSNVTAFRYALIESDTLAIERQAAIYEELELPIAALVHSGSKSLHAIVRIEALSMEEYRERVNFLHKVCEANGLQIDKQNKNPSRLSRMPGVTRKGQPQSLVALNQGKATWAEWKEWIEELNDQLPDIEPLLGVWDNLPPLAPPLIDGILRQGHKMLMSGPSKAGKSYLLLELTVAIAEGLKWLDWQCTKGKVLYINLELDRASCLQRLKLIYSAFGLQPQHLENIDIWNLRGKAVPMDRLAPKLIRRALKSKYVAVVLDPIYKVITGDENAADKMAFFCNQFDLLCTELGAAVIYCHHHSKGAQGQKSSRDRSSGSGVFARDPDAILDLIELQLEKQHRDVLDNRYLYPVIEQVLEQHVPNWQVNIGQDDRIVARNFEEAANNLLTGESKAMLAAKLTEAKKRVGNFSAWRLEGTLREFAPFPAREILFTYPVHVPDTDHILESAKAQGEEAPWVAAQREKQTSSKERKQSQAEALASAFNIMSTFDNDPVMLGDMAEHMGLSVGVLKRQLAKTRTFCIGDDQVVRTREQQDRHVLDTAMAKAKAKDITGLVKLTDLANEMGLSAESGSMYRRLKKDARYTVEGGYVVLTQPEGK